MDRVTKILRGMIIGMDTFSGFAVVVTPLWFLIAALGTKWGFWDWHLGLETMSLVWGPILLVVCLVAGSIALMLIVVQSTLAKKLADSLVLPIVAIIVGGGGYFLHWQSVVSLETQVSILDVTSDFERPPHFTSGFNARRSPHDAGLIYIGKSNTSGHLLSEIQAETWPGIVSLHLQDAPEAVYGRALELAREKGWRIGTASRESGMFEAGTESFWFGFRDDMVVRVVDDGDGGSIVDMRSVARQPIRDAGRNALRVLNFFELLRAS